MDVAEAGLHRVLVLTDPNLAKLPPVAKTLEALESEGIEFELYDQVRVEPTDASFQDAIAVAAKGGFEGYVAVGGGTVIDTAKAANHY